MANLVLFLWLLLSTLISVSVQQCDIQGFENIALDTVKATEINEAGQTIIGLNDTFYNCLSTSQTIGIYNSMSVSILYTRSDNLTRLREVRYNMVCLISTWQRAARQSAALTSNNTRRNCSSCTNQTVNEYHCTRQSLYIAYSMYVHACLCIIVLCCTCAKHIVYVQLHTCMYTENLHDCKTTTACK